MKERLLIVFFLFLMLGFGLFWYSSVSTQTSDLKTPPASSGPASVSVAVPSASGSAALQGPVTPLIFDRTRDTGKVFFSHPIHTNAGNTCATCHEGPLPLFPQNRSPKVYLMSDMYEGKTCGTCHNAKRAFSSMECTRCHSKQ